MRYLNPKADLTFKRVFGEHPDLVMSLLNALLPLAPGQEITGIEYLPAEMVPDNPLKKNSIVDVRCKDRLGRQFIVEMQMIWSPEFKCRVLFNASKAYVRQIGNGENYHLLQPVYSLNLVNDIFEPEMQEYYHHYKLVHDKDSDKVIDGLQLVFVELPKFTPHTYAEKKMQVLWLRFLTEIDENTLSVPKELLENPEVNKAVQAIEESAFTPAQLLGYEKFWDTVSVEKTLYYSAEQRGLARGMEKGMARGMEKGMKEGMKKGMKEGMAAGMKEGMAAGMKEGMAAGMKEGMLKIARKMKSSGMPSESIAQMTELPLEEIEAL